MREVIVNKRNVIAQLFQGLYKGGCSMKKLLLVAIVTLALALAMAGVAFADGGPHGGYTATTDACAGCHRAHTASGPRLLIDVSTYDLCMACHGSTGAGANTNVDDGVYLATRDDAASDENWGAVNADTNILLGGGFAFYDGAAVSSLHTSDGSDVAAWGNGGGRGTTTDLAEALSCASCHDPHGSPNYRIMNETINGYAVVAALVDEGMANKDYDTEQWGAGTSSICAACHGDYHLVAAGQGSILDNGTYTHRIDMAYNYGGNNNPETVGLAGNFLPLAEVDQVVCMTCHLPHGTAATMTGLATGPNTGDSDLLRLDNRGVCEVCHQK